MEMLRFKKETGNYKLRKKQPVASKNNFLQREEQNEIAH